MRQDQVVIITVEVVQYQKAGSLPGVQVCDPMRRGILAAASQVPDQSRVAREFTMRGIGSRGLLVYVLDWKPGDIERAYHLHHRHLLLFLIDHMAKEEKGTRGDFIVKVYRY